MTGRRLKHGDEKMKISARNVFEGRVVDIKKGATTAHVTLEAQGLMFTAAITNEAVEELGLKVGATASAIIKSSDVMISVP
jgi:molybdopterin-binding protein